ncbi:MAG: flagellar hook-length control protein FliK [bacterium]
MVFNPLFFNNSTGFESAILNKPNTSSVNKFLFSDIIKIMADDNTEAITVGSDTAGLKKSGVSLINSLFTQLKSETVTAETEQTSLKITDLLAMLIDGYVPRTGTQQSNTGNLEMGLASKDLKQLLSSIIKSAQTSGELVIKIKNENKNIVTNDSLLNTDELKSILDKGQSIILSFVGNNVPFELTISPDVGKSSIPTFTSGKLNITDSDTDGKFLSVEKENSDYKITLEMKPTGTYSDNTLNYNFEQLTMNDSGVSALSGTFNQPVKMNQFFEHNIKNYKFESLSPDANLKDIVAKIGLVDPSLQLADVDETGTGFPTGTPIKEGLVTADNTNILPILDADKTKTSSLESASTPATNLNASKPQVTNKTQLDGILQQTTGKETDSVKAGNSVDSQAAASNTKSDFILPEELKQYSSDITAIKYVKSPEVNNDKEITSLNNISQGKNSTAKVILEEKISSRVDSTNATTVDKKTIVASDATKNVAEAKPPESKSIKASVESFKQNITNIKTSEVNTGTEKIVAEKNENPAATDAKTAVTDETGKVVTENKIEVKLSPDVKNQQTNSGSDTSSVENKESVKPTAQNKVDIKLTPDNGKVELTTAKNSTATGDLKSENAAATDKTIQQDTVKNTAVNNAQVKSNVVNEVKTEQKNSTLKLKINQQVKAAKTTIGTNTTNIEKAVVDESNKKIVETKTSASNEADTKANTVNTNGKIAEKAVETAPKVSNNEVKITAEAKTSSTEKNVKTESAEVKKVVVDTESKQKNASQTKATEEKTNTQTPDSKVKSETAQSGLESKQPAKEEIKNTTNANLKSAEVPKAEKEISGNKTSEIKPEANDKPAANVKEKQTANGLQTDGKIEVDKNPKVEKVIEKVTEKASANISSGKKNIETESAKTEVTGKNVKTESGENEIKNSTTPVKEKINIIPNTEKNTIKKETEGPTVSNSSNIKTESPEKEIKTSVPVNGKEEIKIADKNVTLKPENEKTVENSTKNIKAEQSDKTIKASIHTNDKAEPKLQGEKSVENPDKKEVTEQPVEKIKTAVPTNGKDGTKLQSDKAPLKNGMDKVVEKPGKDIKSEHSETTIKVETSNENQKEVKHNVGKVTAEQVTEKTVKTPLHQNSNPVTDGKSVSQHSEKTTSKIFETPAPEIKVQKESELKNPEPAENNLKAHSQESPVKADSNRYENFTDKVKSPLPKESVVEGKLSVEKEIVNTDDEKVSSKTVKENNHPSTKAEIKHEFKEAVKSDETHVANETKKVINKEKSEVQNQTVNVVNETLKQEVKNESTTGSDENLKIDTVNSKETATSNSSFSEKEFHSNDKQANSQSRESSRVSEFQVKEKQPFEFMDNKQAVDRTVKTTEIMKEFSRFVEKGEKNTLILQIEPENLGKVKIVLDNSDNVVRATIRVENEAVKAVIENNLSDLYNKLEKSGITLNSVNISLGDADQKQAKYTSSNKKHFAGKKKFNEDEQEDKSSVKSLGYNTYEYLV